MNDEALMQSLRECLDEWLNDPAAQADYQKWLDKLNRTNEGDKDEPDSKQCGT